MGRRSASGRADVHLVVKVYEPLRKMMEACADSDYRGYPVIPGTFYLDDGKTELAESETAESVGLVDGSVILLVRDADWWPPHPARAARPLRGAQCPARARRRSTAVRAGADGERRREWRRRRVDGGEWESAVGV